MKKKENSEKPSNRQVDISALSRFITPVRISLQRTPKEISLLELSEIQQRDDFIKLASNSLNKNGKDVFQSELYESLLKAELGIQKPSSVIVSDSEHFTQLISALKSSGLFTIAKSVELLLAKTKLVKNVSNVIISKKAKQARKSKGALTTQDMRAELEGYKVRLKSWAIARYIKDCDYRQQRNEPRRAKRSGEFSANIWLFDMAKEDLSLNKYEPAALSEALLEGLTKEGNYHGSPEQPDHLLDFKLSSTFFYQCIKEEK